MRSRAAFRRVGGVGVVVRPRCAGDRAERARPRPKQAFTPTRIDPAIRNVFGMRAKFGQASPHYVRDELFERDGLLPVVVRFASPNDASRYPKFTRSHRRLRGARRLRRFSPRSRAMRAWCASRAICPSSGADARRLRARDRASRSRARRSARRTAPSSTAAGAEDRRHRLRRARVAPGAVPRRRRLVRLGRRER